jgi:cobalt/nickel transport system permease protein
MQADLIEYAHGNSPLHRMDARWRLAGIALACVAVVSLRSVPAAGLALSAALLGLAISRLPWRWFLLRLGAVGLFLALFLVLLPFTVPGEGTPLGPLHLSWHGLSMAVLICLKALTVVALALLLFATAPVEVTLRAAHRLHVPGLLVQLLMLTHRYIYLFADELGKLRIALRLRRFRNRLSLHGYRTLGHVTGTLLVRSYERAERVGQAMRSRGFNGRYRTLHSFHTTPGDVAKFLSLTLLVGLLPLALDLWWKWPGIV